MTRGGEACADCWQYNGHAVDADVIESRSGDALCTPCSRARKRERVSVPIGLAYR